MEFSLKIFFMERRENLRQTAEKNTQSLEYKFHNILMKFFIQMPAD